jgi:Uma2 family endonuclease
VLSPDDRWSDVIEKIEEYFSAGVDRVIFVDGKLRRVFVYRSLSEVLQLQESEELVDEELLPGFRLPVSDLFL